MLGIDAVVCPTKPGLEVAEGFVNARQDDHGTLPNLVPQRLSGWPDRHGGASAASFRPSRNAAGPVGLQEAQTAPES